MLQRGDYVFCRDIHSARTDETDVLQLWIPAEYVQLTIAVFASLICNAAVSSPRSSQTA